MKGFLVASCLWLAVVGCENSPEWASGPKSTENTSKPSGVPRGEAVSVGNPEDETYDPKKPSRTKEVPLYLSCQEIKVRSEKTREYGCSLWAGDQIHPLEPNDHNQWKAQSLDSQVTVTPLSPPPESVHWQHFIVSRTEGATFANILDKVAITVDYRSTSGTITYQKTTPLQSTLESIAEEAPPTRRVVEPDKLPSNLLCEYCSVLNGALRNASLAGCVFKDTSFVNVDLDDVVFQSCQFENVTFQSVDLEGVQFRQSVFKNVSFIQSDLSTGTSFDQVTFFQSQFVQSLLSSETSAQLALDPEVSIVLSD